jgi:hypothetical protein
MSKASVDLPEPDTPVTTLNWPRGMHAEVLQVVLAGVDDLDVFGRWPVCSKREQLLFV